MKKNPQTISREAVQTIRKGDAVTLKPKKFLKISTRRLFHFVVTCDPVELSRGLSIIADTEFVAMFSGIVDVSKKA